MEVTELEISSRRSRFADFLELTKPRITLLVLVTTLVGFYMASTESMRVLVLIQAIIGTGFVAAGASALNQYVERDLDARMMRTKSRPLPDGRVLPAEALWFAAAISVIGILSLGFFLNPLTGVLGAATLAAYILVYTPLKTRTTLCTVVGAIPGAMPPLIGWAAARGELNATALALFAIMFLWQMPHFFAIAWIFTEDYARGGFVMHGNGTSTGRQIIAYCCALIPVSLLPTLFGATGWTYLAGAIFLGFTYQIGRAHV